jgi:hypothetical protein
MTCAVTHAITSIVSSRRTDRRCREAQVAELAAAVRPPGGTVSGSTGARRRNPVLADLDPPRREVVGQFEIEGHRQGVEAPSLLCHDPRMASDEKYIIDLCDRVLGVTALRQYRRFPFLKGDSGTPLPVDAYYPALNLVIEYHERQHSEPVAIMDQRQTVSGCSRGEQRRLYDERRQEKLPSHGITLIVLCHTMFDLNSRKRLARNLAADEARIRLELDVQPRKRGPHKKSDAEISN